MFVIDATDAPVPITISSPHLAVLISAAEATVEYDRWPEPAATRLAEAIAAARELLQQAGVEMD